MAEYSFDFPVTPQQLQAIGMVAVEWSYLESVAEAAIWNFAQVPNEDIGAALTTHLTMPARLDMLATLFHLALDPKNGMWPSDLSKEQSQEAVTKLRTVIKTVENLSTRRAEVIHGRWVTGDQGSPLTYTVKARRTLTRTKRVVPDSEIRSLAQAIAEESEAMISFFMITPEGGA